MGTATLARVALRHLFAERAVRRGHFVLASGKESTYYLDCKAALLHPETLRFCGEVLADELCHVGFDALGGPELGAVLLTASVLVHVRGWPREPRGFIVRRAAKDHGTQKLVEGQLEPGDRVVVLEDVTTTGNSILAAIAALEALDVTVVRVQALCDRLAGAEAALAAYNYHALFTIRDFGLTPES